MRSWLTISVYMPGLATKFREYQRLLDTHYRDSTSHQRASIHTVYAHMTLSLMTVVGSDEKCKLIAEELREEIAARWKGFTKPLSLHFRGVHTTQLGKHFALLARATEKEKREHCLLMDLANTIWLAADTITSRHKECMWLDKEQCEPGVILFKKLSPLEPYKDEKLAKRLKKFDFGWDVASEISLAINAKSRAWTMSILEQD